MFMRKGAEVVQLAGTVMIVIITAILTWNFISGGNAAASELEYEDEGGQTVSNTCSLDRDCENNPSGSKCYQIYDSENIGDFTAFCGCVKNEDCTVGVCGKNNRCS
jgi:hypothetical protein